MYDGAIERRNRWLKTLTDSERAVLTGAARRPDGRIHPLPENVDTDLIVGKLVSHDLIERVPDERSASEPFLRVNYKGPQSPPCQSG